MDLDDLKKKQDKAYNNNQITREQAADDLSFYWISQWDDQLLEESQLQFRGEFNIIRKGGRQIMSDLKLNPVQPDFKPKDDSRDDDAELMDGLYRADDRSLASQEAYDYCSQDAVVCGYGAWELYTEYETNQIGDSNQVIRRQFIPEANNTCFWDPNAKRLDKSDANYCSILYKYTTEGYKDLVHDLTGEDKDTIDITSFASPEISYSFPWASSNNELIYVVTFYNREKVKETIITLENDMGDMVHYRLSDVEEVLDELIADGYNVTNEKKIEKWQVTKYIASGDAILSENVIAGDNIPVVPMYGERVIVEGEEHYEGVTRLAKDPQRLRNFQMSYLATIVSQSPRPKPIFFSEQIEGFQSMYEITGSENNYPYLLQNRLDANGQPLPIGPVAIMPEQPIPTALAASIQLSREAVDDVVNAGLPQDISDPDLSGKAVIAIQNRMDNQSYIYQHNFKFAKRRDAEIYASMASEVYDSQRTVTIETEDGNTKKVQMMSSIIDSETGDLVILNDLTNMEFDVYAEIGQSYAGMKQQTKDDLIALHASLDINDPLRRLVMLKIVEMMDGVATDDLKEYARKELIMAGIKEPETEEEMQMVQQAQQNQQPDAMTTMANAEMKKADVSEMKEQRLYAKDQADTMVDAANIQVSEFEAQTDRIKVQVDAEKAGAEIDYKRVQTFGQQMDNVIKASSPFRSSVNAI